MLNISNLAKKNIPEANFKLIEKVGAISTEEGFNSYLVGGLVRDILIEKLKDIDIDIVTETYAPKLAKIVAYELRGELIVHEKYGTAKVKLPTTTIDFTTARTEIYEYPASNPKVSFSSIKEDLFRRDFTINAMAISINNNTFGELLDLYDGYKDIKEKKLKILHDKSFIDDPNRIFRAIRFKSKLSFEIDKYTRDLAIKTMNLGIFDYFINDRIKNEIKISFTNEYNAKDNIKELYDLNSLKFFNTNIDIDFLFEKLDLLERNIFLIEEYIKIKLNQYILYLALLIHNKEDFYQNNINNTQKKHQRIKLIESFRFEVDELKFFREILTINELYLKIKEDISNYDLYKLLNKLNYETLVYFITIYNENTIKEKILLYLNKLKDIKIKLNGNDLINLGFKKGKDLGLILEELKKYKLNNDISDQDEISFVSKFIPTSL
ncbi:MAG: hypothetical protein U0457_20150 [Candidatus Sericytochromatia bacterium]